LAKGRKGSGRHKKNTQQRQAVKQFIEKAASKTPPKAAEPPSGFVHNYGPGVLYAHGPLIMASWTVPTVVEEFLRSHGLDIPLPVTGAMLLDTGATNTAMSIKAADTLGLKATRMAAGFGSGGDTLNPMFNARLHITMANTDGKARVLYWEREVQGIPKLEEHFRSNPLSYAGVQVELIGLLGRDILATTRFVYDGLAGSLKLDFDIKAMGLT
jgi:hypothetical protein